jgi:hypothetical protein
MEILMNPSFLTVTVAALALVALLQLGLHIALRREVRGLRKSYEARIKARRETKDSLRSEMLQISEELVALNKPALAAVSIGQSMNLSRRNQVLRMHLRGDSPLKIAGALKISKSEVDLLLKIHRTVLPPAAWSPGANAPTHRRAGDMPANLAGESHESGAMAATA